MKKVVILSAFLSPLRSGAEACAEEVPLALSDQFALTIVTARMDRSLPKRDMLQGSIPVIRVGVGVSFLDKWLYPFLAPLIVRKLKPDVVHAVLETFAGLALTFCTAPKKILTCQTTNRTFLKRFVLRSPDIVTAISTSLVATCREYGRDDVVLIPNGVNLTAVRDALSKVPQMEKGSIVFVGRLEKMKGIDTLLHAFAQLKMENGKLKIIGDGSQRKNLESLAKKLGVADRVTFTGYLPTGELEKEYARAQIFCGLSRSEAYGNVFLEAQAAGCAVIGTSVGGIPDIIEHERSGLLVPPNDPKAAAKALTTLLEDDRLRDRLRESGMSSAQQRGWKMIAQKYGEIYRS